MKLSKFNKYLIAGLGIVILILWIALGRKSASTGADMQTGVVKRQDLIQRITISGPVTSLKRLDVKPSFVGYVQKIHVQVGDMVKPGDPLVTFSPSLSNSETNYPVRATFPGQVTMVLKTQGEYVADTGDQNLVIRVEDKSQLFVTASVPELDIAKVKVGQKASIKVSSLVGESFNGSIKEISLSAKDKDRWSSSSTEFQIKIAIDSTDQRLFSGMSALCDVITARADKALVLTHEYIQPDDDGNYFVTLENGQKRNLKVGLQTDEGVEVKEGLQEGDRVRIIDFLSLPKVED